MSDEESRKEKRSLRESDVLVTEDGNEHLLMESLSKSGGSGSDRREDADD